MTTDENQFKTCIACVFSLIYCNVRKVGFDISIAQLLGLFYITFYCRFCGNLSESFDNLSISTA